MNRYFAIIFTFVLLSCFVVSGCRHEPDPAKAASQVHVKGNRKMLSVMGP